ncbi:MAG: efflux RND transporter periplasmic adaptor subunit [Balneolaceae bacterium]
MKQSIHLLLIFTLLTFYSCSSEETAENGENNDEVIPSVEAVEAQFGSLPLQERLSGIVRAQKQVDIYARISAPIVEVYKQDGEDVEEGEPLLQLSDREYRERVRQAEANLRINQARLKQAEAALNQAKSQLRRQQILDERELSSELEMETLQAELQSAEANYELALAQVEETESTLDEQKELLGQTVIRSPITGTVGQKNAEMGMQVGTSDRLFTVGDLNDARVTINLTERMLNYIEEGQRAIIRSENMEDRMLESTVSRISPFLGVGSFSTEAEIDIENTRGLLIPGMFVTVDIMYGETDQATIVPLSAIYRHPRTGETGVFVAPEFGAEAEPVEQVDNANPPPLSEPNAVEFVSIDVIAKGRETAGVVGVNSGDWVVTVGHNLLINNDSGIARIRATSWNRIIDMQNLKPRDLLREIMNERGVAEQSSGNTTDQS